MEDNIRIVNKKCGQTPLECINELKKIEPRLAHLPITYAGRLDPLAEGVLVLLIGDECLKKDEYLALTKEYEVTVLFGFSTDTYDLMGEVMSSASSELLFKKSSDEGGENRHQTILNSNYDSTSNTKKSDNSEMFEKALSKFIGRINQKYPVYSSRTVNGKPLYKWAREGKLDEIEIPSHNVFVEKIELIKEGEISGEKLHKKIKNDIGKVNGDFRQEKILKIWNEILKDKKGEKYKTITLRISCGSGVYIRGIANEIGQVIRIPSLVLNIKRTKVGKYFL